VVAADAAGIRRAAALLRDGGLVAFPTETVYGLGAHALDERAVSRLFDAKGRPSTDPLIVHVHSVEGIDRLVAGIPERARALAAAFWPGPLTLVLPRSSRVPDRVTAGLDTVAVRIPAHPVAQALLEAAAVPVAAPSANLFSRPSPTRAAHVIEDLDGRIDLVLDGGATTVGVESTVLDLSGPVPTILRPGAITLEMLREVLPEVRSREGAPDPGAAEAAAADAAASPQRSPGLLEKHYSPRAPLTLYEGADALAAMVRDAKAALADGGTVGVLMTADDEPLFMRAIGPGMRGLQTFIVGPSNDLAAIASNLYAGLRSLDAAGVDVVLARSVSSESGLGAAVRDRLRRAAAGRIVHA
jgi:L-threonylcarbamoyladenylate synthase